MTSIEASRITGLTGLEVAVELGYDPADVAGVAVEPGEVRVAVRTVDDEGAAVVATQHHPVVAG